MVGNLLPMGGTPLVNEDGTEVTMDKDIAVKAAEFVKSLYDDGYVAEGIDDHQEVLPEWKSSILYRWNMGYRCIWNRQMV